MIVAVVLIGRHDETGCVRGGENAWGMMTADVLLTVLQFSLALSATVILKALHQRANFYSACVYLSQSNANLMVIRLAISLGI